MVPTYIVGSLMLAATFFNIVMLPKELWFTLSDGVLVIIGFLVGRQLGMKKITTEVESNEKG